MIYNKVAVLFFCVLLASTARAQTNQNNDGTAGFIPVFTQQGNIGNSRLFQGSGVGFENSGVVLGIGTTNPMATLHLNFGDTSNQDVVMLGDCAVKCLVIGDPDHAFLQAFKQNLVITGDTVILDSAGQLLMFNPRKVPEANVGIGVDVATNILTIKQNSVTNPIADAWTTYSSARWKTNIQPIANALDKVQQLRGVTFDWKANGKHDLGVVAEEVAAVVPEIVGFEQSGKAQSVDYGRLTALLLEAIKEQQNEIRELKVEMESLSGQKKDMPVTMATRANSGQSANASANH